MMIFQVKCELSKNQNLCIKSSAHIRDHTNKEFLFEINNLNKMKTMNWVGMLVF